MGILDDAIREHLELKRSHGAPEEEIQKKEAEAFGAVRQDAPAAAAETQVAEPGAVADTEMDDAPVAAETHVAEPATPDIDALQPAPEDPYEVHPGDHPVPDPAAEAGAGLLAPSEVEPGPPTAPEQRFRPPTDEHPALVDHDRFHHEEHPPEPVFRHAAEEALEPAPEDPYIGDPAEVRPGTEEPPPRQSPERADEHEVGEIDSPSDDVLEDTPEFLQDAPEHDRLWFEQKPPRDFDFGE